MYIPRPTRYPVITVDQKVGDFTIQLTLVRDLDEAIDLLCKDLDATQDLFAEDLCPYYGVIWPSGYALAEHIAGLPPIKGRILEIGCYIGLPSLVCGMKNLAIAASDFHPDVESLYRQNCEKNGLHANYLRFNWMSPPEEMIHTFDVILGSDILYEGRHAKDVAYALTALVKAEVEIWIADPGRGYLQSFVDQMNLLGWREHLIPRKTKDQEIFLFHFKKK